MHLGIVVNQTLAHLLHKADSSNEFWSLYHQTPQVLAVNVVASPSDPLIGHNLSLAQHLVEYVNVATYEGGGQLISAPKAGLGGNDEDFFEHFGSSRVSKVLRVIANPVATVPTRARIPENDDDNLFAIAWIEELIVYGRYFINLCDQDNGQVLRQWTWGYGFNVSNYADATKEIDEPLEESIPIRPLPSTRFPSEGNLYHWTDGYTWAY